MPIVELHLLEGYDAAAKHRLGTALTNAVRLVVPAAPEAITVLIHDLPSSDYYRGGQTRSPAPASPAPDQIVRDYLSAMEARDLDRARAMLAPGFVMQFPGTGPMHDLAQLIEWAAPRYRFVTKTYDGFDTAPGADRATVYCRGTLSGEWPDGTAFEGIRFVDRFDVIGDKIHRQDVWNDIAETQRNNAT